MAERKRRYPSLYARLVANTADPETHEKGCWEWTAAVGKRRGREYPRINVWNLILRKRESKRAHRVMVEEFYGVKLTPEIDVDHTCLNIKCICPWHLEPVTREVNLLRRFDRSAGVPLKLPNRHELDEAALASHGWTIYKPGSGLPIPF